MKVLLGIGVLFVLAGGADLARTLWGVRQAQAAGISAVAGGATPMALIAMGLIVMGIAGTVLVFKRQ